MRRRLFLTGPIGCGKSTAIETALGTQISQCGGFLTRRHRQPHLYFTLESPDGSSTDTFLDFASGKPEVNLSAFSKVTFRGQVLIMDEIGGIELLNADFVSALKTVLTSDVPILGVIKGNGPAGALIRTLGLTQEYESAIRQLRQMLMEDPDTLVYECTQYDKEALRLTRQWTEEYLHGNLL